MRRRFLGLVLMLQRYCLFAAMLVMLGCTMPPTRVANDPMPEDAPVSRAALVEDQQLAELMARYRLGIQRMVAGEDAELELSGIAAQLSNLAARCARNPACDLERVMAGYAELLGEQSRQVRDQAQAFSSLNAEPRPSEPPEAGADPAAVLRAEDAHRHIDGTDLADMIRLNTLVKAGIDEWLTWKRADLVEAYENYQFLRPKISPFYRAAGLPEALLFGIMAKESLGRAHAVSRAGAVGLLQFMPATGKRLGLSQNGGFDDRYDPVAATRANVQYIRDELRRHNNQLEFVLAAYNGGEGRMRRLAEANRGKSFWDREIYFALPRETREYVPSVMAAAWIFLHAEELGLNLPRFEGRIVELPLVQQASLGELTICLGQSENSRDGWFRTLRNLNPRHQPHVRLKPGTVVELPHALVPVYREKCVDTELASKAAEFHLARHPPEGTTRNYVVQRGDTLNGIARGVRCSTMQDLAQRNQIPGPRYPLRIGQVLKIPNCGA